MNNRIWQKSWYDTPVSMRLSEYKILALSHLFVKAINKTQKAVSNFHHDFSLFCIVIFASYCKVANCKTLIHDSTSRLGNQNLIKMCFSMHYSRSYSRSRNFLIF